MATAEIDSVQHVEQDFSRRGTCQWILGMQIVVFGSGDIQVGRRGSCLAARPVGLMIVTPGLAAVAGGVHP